MERMLAKSWFFWAADKARLLDYMIPMREASYEVETERGTEQFERYHINIRLVRYGARAVEAGSRIAAASRWVWGTAAGCATACCSACCGKRSQTGE